MAPNQPERPAEIPSDGQRNPERQQQWLGLVDLLPIRVRTLVFLAMLAGTGTLATQPGCGLGEEAVDTASDPVLLSTVRGTLDAKLYRTGEAEVTDEHGKTLYHFLKGELKKRGKMDGLTEPEQQNLIDVMIHFCNELNPAENINDFPSIKGKTLIFPETMYLSTGEYSWLLDMGFDSRLDKDEEILEGLNQSKGKDIEELNGELDSMLENLARVYDTGHDSNAMAILSQIDVAIERTDARNYHDILEKYSVYANKLETPAFSAYEAMTIAQILEQLDGNEKEKAEEALKGKMYMELVRVLQGARPDEVASKRLLHGTVLDAATPFYNLKEVWTYKRDKKSEKEDKAFYDEALKQLEGKSNTMTLTKWLETQEKACGYFQKNGEALGYDPELAHYMTPAVILSVMHAEFFSELSGKAYLDLLPVAMESGNLPYGPSVGDREVSMGEVQLLKRTFELLLGSKRDGIRTLQAQDTAIRILTPEKKSVMITVTEGKGKKKKKVQKEIQRYDQADMVKAMITDADSHAFYTILTIAYHIELGFDVLMKDTQFKEAWRAAPASDKYLFMASFSASAINNGRGSSEHNNGAYQAAVELIERVNSSSLSAYIGAIPEAAKASVPITKLGKQNTVSRGARKGYEAMTEMLKRVDPFVIYVSAGQPVSKEPQAPIAAPTAEAPKRVPVLMAYSIMRDRAISEGFPLSTTPEANRPIYMASKFRGIPIPETGEGYARKSGPESEAIMDADALKIFQDFAKEFKKRTGYSLTFTDALRTPEIQAKESPIMDSTHFTGRTLDIADGRFWDPNGNEITWTDFSGKKPKRGPNADLIENTLRPAMITLLEEYQARGLMMAFDETSSGGHWHIYIPKTYRGPVESF